MLKVSNPANKVCEVEVLGSPTTTPLSNRGPIATREGKARGREGEPQAGRGTVRLGCPAIPGRERRTVPFPATRAILPVLGAGCKRRTGGGRARRPHVRRPGGGL